MKLIEINGVPKILEDDDIKSPPVDFFSPEEETKVAEYVVENFFSENNKKKESALEVALKFKEKIKEGIEVNCVSVRKTVSGNAEKKSVTAKIGRFAFFKKE